MLISFAMTNHEFFQFVKYTGDVVMKVSSLVPESPGSIPGHIDSLETLIDQLCL